MISVKQMNEDNYLTLKSNGIKFTDKKKLFKVLNSKKVSFFFVKNLLFQTHILMIFTLFKLSSFSVSLLWQGKQENFVEIMFVYFKCVIHILILKTLLNIGCT